MNLESELELNTVEELEENLDVDQIRGFMAPIV